MRRRILPILTGLIFIGLTSLLLPIGKRPHREVIPVEKKPDRFVNAESSSEQAPVVQSKSVANDIFENNINKSARGEPIRPSVAESPVSRRPRGWKEIVPRDGATLPVASLEEIFAAAPGRRVVLPFPTPLSAVVNMNHLHDSGSRAVGLHLPGAPNVFAFLQREPGGRISGHLLSRSEETAFAIDPGNIAGTFTVRSVSAQELICARKDAGNSLAGLPLASDVPEGGQSEPGEPQGTIPLLESNPGAPKTIYLDFDGESVSGTSWNQFNGGKAIVAAPYANTQYIQAIWESIAEDYRIFNVNVTTSRSVFNSTPAASRCMVIFTPTSDWYGDYGGVAYLNSFGSSVNYMCWVFNSGLNGAAEAASHEAGHQLGLQHDGDGSTEYYSGHTHPSGVSWGPIMGASYGRSIVQFSQGEYSGASQQEDDLAKIGTYLPMLPDDHGNGTADASIPAETAPGALETSGIISGQGDHDVFRLQAGIAGTISIEAEPHPNYRNLDLHLQLLDSAGSVLAEAKPNGAFDAHISLSSQPAGTYYVRVQGSDLGTSSNGYTRYGSAGAYILSGTYPYSNIPAAPSELSATDGISSTSIVVAWTVSSKATGYRLFRSTSSNSATATLIADTTTNAYIDSAAVPETPYYYFVTAYNEDGESDMAGPESGHRLMPLPGDPGSLSASDGSSTAHTAISWSAASYAAGYYVYRNTVATTEGAEAIAYVSGTQFHDVSGAAEYTYYYFVRANNSAGLSSPGPIDSGSRAAALPKPSGLSGTAGTMEGKVLLTWNAVTGADTYRVYRSIAADPLTASELGEVNFPGFEDSALSAGVVYHYFVKALGAAGDSAYSDAAAGYAGLAGEGDDAYEANDTLSEAWPLEGAERTWLCNYLGKAKAADEDWYRIAAKSGTNRIDVLALPSGGDIGLSLHDADGLEVAAATPAAGGWILTYPGATAGASYYIRVTPDGTDSTVYNLAWSSLKSGDTANRVDISIGNNLGNQIGQFYYHQAGRRQSLRQKVKGTQKTLAFLSTVNEGTEKAQVATEGTGSSRMLRVKYRLERNGAWRNITAAMKRGPLRETYAPLEDSSMQVKIKPSREGSSRNRRFLISVGSKIGDAEETMDAASIKVAVKKGRSRSRTR